MNCTAAKRHGLTVAKKRRSRDRYHPTARLAVGLLAACFVTFAVCLEAYAQEREQVDSAITVVTADGVSLPGTVQSLSADRLSLLPADSRQPRELPTADLLRVSFDRRQPLLSLPASVILLANGDRLAARPLRTEENQVVAEWIGIDGRPPLHIPLETIAALALNAPPTERAQAALFQALDRRQKSDVLILHNGDRLTGELAGFDPQTIAFEGAVGKTEIDRAGVRAIAFNADLVSFLHSDGKRVLLTLTNGSRLTVRNLNFRAGEQVDCEALYGEKLVLPLSAVVSLQFFGGRAVYLSDLAPAEYRFTPFLTTKWELRADRNVTGGPLRLAGQEYAKGLGMHSRSEVTYDLGGKSRRFQAVVGIDDGAGEQGSVIFGVAVDGKRIYTSGVSTGKSPPQLVGPLDLTGARRLTLIVEFGPLGDIQDHANWCDAVVVQ